MLKPRERKVVGNPAPFKPKNYKELVDWYLVQIESGNATRREFVQLAEGLNKPKKKAPAKKKAVKPATKPKGKATSVDELKAVAGKKPAEKK